MDKNSPSFGLKITTLVVPATNYINNEDVEKIKELIQDSVFYLESMTECRYYPVPTIILDEIPPKDRERYGDKEECDSDNEKPDLNSLGVYFHPGSHPSTDFKNKLEQFGYEDIFIESLFAGGVVAVAYDRSIEYLRIKHEGFKKNWDKNKKLIYMWDRDIEKLNKCREELEDFREFFLKMFKVLLIHEHGHAITFEGKNSKNKQIQYSIEKFYKTYAYKIVCESIAEWLSIHYYSEENSEEENLIIYNFLVEQARRDNTSLLIWPYGGAIYLEETYKNERGAFIKVFNNFRKNVADAVPLFLSNANEFVIKSFCAFKKGDFQSVVDQIKGKKSILPEAIKFIEDDWFFVKLIDNGADLNGQDIYGDTALIACCGVGNLAHVELLCSKKVGVNKQNNAGDTALIFAGLNNRLDIVLRLLLAGARHDIKNNKGKALLDLDISDEIRQKVTRWADNSNDEI